MSASNGNGRGRLFEFAVLYHPRATKEQAERGETPKSIVLGKPETVLATSDKEVGILAARSLPDEYLGKLEDVEILIRPF